jgi:hypothetical protein
MWLIIVLLAIIWVLVSWLFFDMIKTQEEYLFSNGVWPVKARMEVLFAPFIVIFCVFLGLLGAMIFIILSIPNGIYFLFTGKSFFPKIIDFVFCECSKLKKRLKKKERE